MKWKLAIVVILLAAGGGFEYWALKKRAEQVCHTARNLALHANVVSDWILEASADPFLGEAALRGHTNSVIALYRDKSRWIVSEFGTKLLPENVKQIFLELSLEQPGTPGMASALKKLPPMMKALQCGSRLPASPNDEELAKLVDTGNLFWAERRALAIIEKQEFTRDKTIYCKGEELLKGLRRVIDAATSACQTAPPGSKLAKTCKAGHEASSLEAEIQDLEKQKEFNLKKMRQKWPDPILQGLQC